MLAWTSVDDDEGDLAEWYELPQFPAKHVLWLHARFVHHPLGPVGDHQLDHDQDQNFIFDDHDDVFDDNYHDHDDIIDDADDNAVNLLMIMNDHKIVI